MPGTAVDPLKFGVDPRYRYLRVQAPGSTPALLVLGYVDPHPLGPIEVWYSASGEVLKLQNGRVVAAHGLAMDWPSVRFDSVPVAWRDVDGRGSTYVRSRDEIPSYRFGVRETVLTMLSEQAPILEGFAVSLPASAKLTRWYQESAQGPDGVALHSWFALATHRGEQTIVFSEQCMTQKICLRIQVWPAYEGDM